MTATARIGMWTALACCLAAGLAGAGCTGHGIPKKKSLLLRQQVQTRGLIVGFEGLQPFSAHRADNLTEQVARELHLAQVATSGNSSAHLPLAIEAHAHNQPIYIVGYSLGGHEARKLAEKCRRAGVPVDIMFLLDPGSLGNFKGRVPANVRKVVFYLSGSYDSSVRGAAPSRYLEDPYKTRVEFEDLYNLNHMNLPSHVVRKIRGEIREDAHSASR